MPAMRRTLENRLSAATTSGALNSRPSASVTVAAWALRVSAVTRASPIS